MKMLIVGHDTDEQTMIDYMAGEDTTAICDEWERVRGPSFKMVATWDVDELQDTLNTIRRTSEQRLIEDWEITKQEPEERTHLHEKADEAAAYERFVKETNRYIGVVTKHNNPAAGDQLGAVDRTILATQRDRLSFGEPEVGRLSSRESNLKPEDPDGE